MHGADVTERGGIFISEIYDRDFNPSKRRRKRVRRMVPTHHMCSSRFADMRRSEKIRRFKRETLNRTAPPRNALRPGKTQ